MIKLKYNYHTHTYRCGHAHGQDEEYVKNALNSGLKELGFSDHIFYPGLPQYPIRQSEEQFPDYVNCISELRDKYKKQIKIFIGFESEFFEAYEGFYRGLLEEGKIQYLILGNHCYLDETGYHWMNQDRNDKELALKYVNSVVAGIESGLFVYVAHPDLFLNSYTNDDEFRKKQIDRICEASKRCNVPLEINLEGCRKKVQADRKFIDEDLEQPYYPHMKFWEAAKRHKCKIIIGIDAHRPEDLSKPYVEMVEYMVKKLHLKLLRRIKIKDKYWVH